MLKVYQILCTIWYRAYNFKNVKNTHEGVLILVKLQAYFTKSDTRLIVHHISKLMASDKFILNAVLKLKNFPCKQHS